MSNASLDAATARQRLYEVMQADEDFETKAQRALEIGIEYLGVENAHITKIDPESGYWEAVVSTDTASEEFPPGLKLDLSSTYCRRAIDGESPIALHNATEQGWRDDAAYREHGLQCYHGTTLRVEGDVFGTLCFVSKQPRAHPFTDNETMFAELMTRMLEFELEHEQQAAELTRRANVINVLDRVLRHNLRNNLTVIQSHLNLLAGKVDSVPANLDLIFQKIDDLLSLSDTARQLDTIVNEEFEFRELDVRKVTERVVSKVEGKYPETSFEVTGKSDITLRAAPSLERAIAELVENAAKHSPDDTTVTISLDLEPNRVRIAVSDEGPGLPEPEQEVLKGASETPLTHGSGLGLWLVYRIVAAHDGEILVSTSGDGTSITVAVPRPAAALDTPDSSLQMEFEQVYDRFRAVFDDAFDSMVIVDENRRIMDVNDSGTRLVDREREGLIGRRIDDFAVEQEELERSWTELEETGHARGTISIAGQNESPRTVEFTASADIVPGQHLIIIRDITERLEQEKELRATKQRLDVALEATDTGVFEWEIGTNSVIWSSELEQIVGLSPGEFEGTYESFTSRTHPDDLPDLEETIEDATEHGQRYTAEFRLLHEDGRYVWVEARGKRIEIDETQKLVGIVTEIVDRKKQERELRETKKRLESVIKASPNPIILLNAAGEIKLWNDAAEEIFGHDRDTVIDQKFIETGIVPSDKVDMFEDRFERILAGGNLTGLELDRRTKDGEPVALRLSTAPLSDEEDNIDGVVAITEVLSERAED